MGKLCQARWQGNIRELRNCIESMVVLAPGSVLDESLLPRSVSEDEPVFAPQITEKSAGEIEKPVENALDIRDAELKLIEQALEKCGNNRTRAAEMLGISRRTLQRKLAALGK